MSDAHAAGRTAVDRLSRVLVGAAVTPAVIGMTFVDPSLLPAAGPASGPPAVALVRVCAELRLDFAFVPSWEPWAAEAVRGLRGAGVASLWVVPGVLWPALGTVGVAQGLQLVGRAPQELESALDAAARDAGTAVRRGLELGADGFVVADDLAGTGGPIASPDYLRAAVFPRLAAIVAAAAAGASAPGTGPPVLLHCDGAAASLYADARAAGFAAVHGDCGGPGRVETAFDAARCAGLGLVGGLAAAELTGPAQGVAAGTRVSLTAARGGLAVADDGGVATRDGCAALIAALAATGPR